MALFGDIGDKEEILRTLCSRQHWGQIRTDVLRALISNAKDDVLKIERIVFVSEYFDCVKGNFVDLANIWADPRLALSAFGATLVGLAGDIVRHLGELPNGSARQSQAIMMVEVSYLSALLCDPYMLTAYRGLASLYHATGKAEMASSMCRKYDETEQELLRAQGEYARQYRETKYKPVAAAMRAEMDGLKAQLGSQS